MTAPVQQCQPGSVIAVARYVEIRRRQPLSQLDDVIHAIHTGTEYGAELKLSDIAALQARVEEHEWTIDLLEANARVQAKLLADTGRRAEELTEMLRWARRRIEFLGVAHPDSRHYKSNEETFLPAIDKALAMPLEDRS